MFSVTNITRNFFIRGQEFEVHFYTDHLQLFAVVDRQLVFICDLKNSEDAQERAKIWMGE